MDNWDKFKSWEEYTLEKRREEMAEKVIKPILTDFLKTMFPGVVFTEEQLRLMEVEWEKGDVSVRTANSFGKPDFSLVPLPLPIMHTLPPPLLYREVSLPPLRNLATREIKLDTAKIEEAVRKRMEEIERQILEDLPIPIEIYKGGGVVEETTIRFCPLNGQEPFAESPACEVKDEVRPEGLVEPDIVVGE